MANHKSAEKRAKQGEKKNLRNRMVKTHVKTAVKKVLAAVTEKDENAASVLDMAKSAIDKAAKKGVIHKRNAARKISRLAKKLNAINKANA
ncbi:30S ribosomal protein S20 [Desulforegula conservatrix]|uniref:30S ribosomal protein S20 n=1 Tax=Desulforegula conservatrix TaxID=153026 RepID=UPI000419AC42|nr:30S ribosomal protein S20 [Desulforegula conservatrix]